VQGIAPLITIKFMNKVYIAIPLTMCFNQTHAQKPDNVLCGESYWTEDEANVRIEN
jgi:hypothetical protein